MEQTTATILAVDDDVVNLEIIEACLEDEDYRLVTAPGGEEAWALLQERPDRFDAVLLDRMMPKMDGMAVLSRMKADPALQSIPVIMQTAAAAPDQMREGLSAGAYYYLSKPFEKDTLRTIVRSALRDYALYCSMRTEIQAMSGAVSLLVDGRFRFRTLTEAKSLSALLSGAFPESERVKVGVGLCELLLNAVEHGNLGLTYQDKSRLLSLGSWDEEVARRLMMPPYADRYATVDLRRDADSISVVITDQGEGFDWHPYLDFSLDRATDAHGRGIATARQVCFTNVEYRGKGNEVVATLAVSAAGLAGSMANSAASASR